MSLVADTLSALWRKLALEAPDPHGPGGAFARTMAVVLQGEGAESVLHEDDGLELLCRALDPEHERQDLAYPGFDRVREEDKVGGLEAGLALLGEAVRASGFDGEEVTVDLFIGTLLPVPGPGRRPVIEEIFPLPEEEPRFARVEYRYEGDAAGHSLSFYRDEAGAWQLDLVWEIAKAGVMQEALGHVQVPSCSRQKLEV